MKCPNCGHVFGEGWPEACLDERCSYYTHYLRHGPPNLNHAAFHDAEAACRHWQRKAEMWYKEHPRPDQGNLPRVIESMCQKLEKEVRA